MADETVDQRVQRLSQELGTAPAKAQTPDDIEQSLAQDFGYQFAEGPERVRRRKEAYERAGVKPPTFVSRPGSRELNEEGPVHKYVRPGLEAAGTALGTIAGTPLGPFGVAGGAVLGYAGGDTLASLAERIAGERPPIKSLPQAGRETVDALKRGGLVEAGGRAVGWAGSKLIAPFAGQYQEANRTVDEIAKERGINLDPYEVLQNRPLALGHKVLENVPFTSGMVQRNELQKLGTLTKEWQGLREKVGAPDRQRLGDIGMKIQDQVERHLDKIGARQGDVRDAMRDELLKQAGSPVTYKELGEATQKAITERYQGLKDVENAAWEYARQGIPDNGRVLNTNLANTARKIRKEYENFPSFLDEPLLRQLDDVAKSGNKEYDALAAKIPVGMSENARATYERVIQKDHQPGWSFTSLLKLRSELSDAIDAHHSGTQMGDMKQGSADRYGKIYLDLKSALDKDLEAFAKNAGSDVTQRLAMARSASGERLSFFDQKQNPFMVKAVKANADNLEQTLIKPGNAAGYSALKERVGEGAVAPVKQAFTNRLLGVGGREEGGLAQLRSTLDRYGKQTLAEIYAEPELKQLYDLADKSNWMKKSPVGNPFFRELIKTSPTKVAPTILEHPDLTAKTLRMFPNMKQPLRQSFVEGVHPNEKTPFPTRLIDTLNAYPPEVQRQLFTQEELKDFYELARIIDRTKGTVKLAENPSGTAQNLVTFTTAGAMLKHPLANAPQALSTAAIAKLYLSKTGRKYLLEGLMTPTESERAAKLGVQMSTIAGLSRTTIPARDEEQ